MMGKDAVFSAASFLGLVAIAYFSYKGYMIVAQQEPIPVLEKETKVLVAGDPLRAVTMTSLNTKVPLANFQAVEKRNPFEQVKPKVKKKAPVKVPAVKKIEPPKIEPIVEEPEERYYYRGLVVMADKTKYVIERERDRKTFFVNAGDRTKDFVVIETSKKEVVIADYDENIKVLKKVAK